MGLLVFNGESNHSDLIFFSRMYGDLTLKTKVLYIVTFSSPDVVDGEAL